MKDLIILAGAPGVGKSTIGEILREEAGFPLVDFGWLRGGHLKSDWSDANRIEEQMAFENFVFIVKNYWRHGYKNVVATDFTDETVLKVVEEFHDADYIIATLVANDDELAKRVTGERDSGFKDVDAAVAWNRSLKARPLLARETRIDNTHTDPQKTAQEIMKLVGG